MTKRSKKSNPSEKPEDKSKSNKDYFTIEHENAILEYAHSQDQKRKNEIYRYTIKPAFGEMIRKIVYRYKFAFLPNIEDLIVECEGHLGTILNKFDNSKGSKAFSYYSVITKNWFSAKAKKNSVRMKKETQLSDQVNEDFNNAHSFARDDEHHVKISEVEFYDFLCKEMNSWDNDQLKPNEKKLLEAIKILFNNSSSVEIFNKKAIYLYLREMTNLNTKQILSGLKRLRTLYLSSKRKWYY